MHVGGWAGLCLFLASAQARSEKKVTPPDTYELPIHMPEYQPTKNDDYVCTTVPVKDDGYIVGYRPTAHADRVHHMLLYGCDQPGGQAGKVWNCMHGQLCRSSQKILYAWARNAPAFKLPDDVAFPIGKATGYSNLVLQVHYATPLDGEVWDYSGVTLDMSPTPTPFSAAVFIFVGMMSPIPANTATFFMNISCAYQDNTEIHPFAFRTHTHGLGRLVSAAVQRPADKHWDIIGKRNPQWPQLFQKIPSRDQISINKDDLIAAQCRYNSSERQRDTSIGATGEDEMCNFYMMYYWKTSEKAPWRGAGGSCVMDSENLFSGSHHYPNQASKLLPPSPMDEEHAKQASVSFGRWTLPERRWKRDWNDGLMASRRRGYPDYGAGGVWADAGAGEAPGQLPLATPNRVFHLRHQEENRRLHAATQTPAKSSKLAPGRKKRVKEVGKWGSAGGIKFGQVAGLAMTPSGNLLVFHRGEVVWGPGTFDNSNVLRERKAVSVDAVVEVDTESGDRINSWGSNRFYMPHGIATDHDGNIWTTDVGLHQVQQFTSAGKLIRSLGEAFVPGNDRSHFCKPAGVAVSSKGLVFIADGYCNQRVVVFDTQGKYINEFGAPNNAPTALEPPLGYFNLPHDITLHEEVDHMHVADRQNGRVQMMFTNGTVIKALRPGNEFNTVYASDYCSHDGNVFLLPGEPGRTAEPIKAFSVNPSTGKIAYSFSPSSRSFQRPHILRTTKDCSKVFVGEIAGNQGNVWRFDVLTDSPPIAQPPSAPVVKKSGSGTKADEGKTTGPSLVKRKDGGMGLVGLIFVLSLVAIFLSSIVCICIKCRGGARRGRNNMNLQSISNGFFGGDSKSNRSHKGFQPLRTEDIDAMDDITDESDDDELYTQRRSK